MIEKLLNKAYHWIFQILITYFKNLRNDRFDFIIASGGPFPTFIGSYIISILLGIPLILDYRDLWTCQRSRGLNLIGTIIRKLSSFCEAAVIRRAKHIIVVTPGMRQVMMKKFRIPNDKITVILNGHDYSLSQMAAKKNLDAKKISFLYTGKVYLDSAVNELTAILDELRNNHPTSYNMLEIHFAGIIEAPYRRILDDSGHDYTWLGYFDSKSIRDMQSNAEILFSFDKDPIGIPTKIYEYLAAQRPVLIFTHENSDCEKLFGNTRGVQIGYLNNPRNSAEILAEMIKGVKENDIELPDDLVFERFARTTALRKLNDILK